MNLQDFNSALCSAMQSSSSSSSFSTTLQSLYTALQSFYSVFQASYSSLSSALQSISDSTSVNTSVSISVGGSASSSNCTISGVSGSISTGSSSALTNTLETFNSELESFYSTLGTAVGNITDINNPPKLSSTDMAKFTGAFQGLLSSLKSVSSSNSVIQAVVSSLESFSSTLTSAAQNLSNGSTVEKFFISPRVNSYVTPASQFEGAKIKIDSINALITVCQSINDSLSTATTSVVREWIKKLKSQHPKIDNALEDLDYFQPISEEIGSRILSKDLDTPDLELEYWGTDATSLRSITKQKMNSDLSDDIEGYYLDLNTKMVSNISNEFFEERKVIEEAMTAQGRSAVAHDFHLAGDLTWPNYIDTTKSTIEITLLSYLGDAVRLINYLYPINISVIYSNDSIELSIEGVDISINYKGDKVTEPATAIDTSVITPEVEDEE